MNDQDQVKIQQDEFEAHYRAKTTPWDLGRPDFNLVDAVTRHAIQSCRALDIGCGTGHNSIWLSQQGFEVTGVDVSETALARAVENAAAANAVCSFRKAAFLEQEVPGAPFAFLFDRGCWHLLDVQGRRRFAERAAACLVDGGLWLSIIGSADEPPRDSGPLDGPPRHSACDITEAVEPCFEILRLEASHFDSDHPRPPRAWVCLMRKRRRPPATAAASA